MTTQLKPLADRAAQTIISNGGMAKPTWQELRDYCDTFSGGELECKALDILTDMTAARLKDSK